MNKIELRHEIKELLLGKHSPEGIKGAELVGPDPAQPDPAIEVITDDPFDLANPEAVRRFRITVEEVTD